jgi:transcriptional regulator with XRE-family HTH domain
MRSLTRLKEHRKRRRLTQEELAKLSDVSRPTIARLETTSTRATPNTARNLAKVLKVKPRDLR